MFSRVQELGLVAVEGGLGSGSCLGNSSSLLPAAHCTSAFPSTKAKSKLCRSPRLVQDHLHGTVPMPADLPVHSDFLFSPPHPSPFSTVTAGLHAAHQHRGTPEIQLSELGGQQAALVLRTVVLTAMGWPGTPESPSPRAGFISRWPLHSQKRSETTTEAEPRGNFQSPLPTSCLPGPLH